MGMTLKPIAYLGVPYSDPDPTIRKFRERAATQMVFDLLKQGILAYSPITHNVPVIQLGAFGGYQSWLDFDHSMLSRCNKLLVFKLPGWKQSKGLAAEIEFAKTIGLPIEEIEPLPQFLNKISITDAAANSSSDRITLLLNNINFCNEIRDCDQFLSPKNLAMNLQVESTDLAENFLWLTEEQSRHITPTDKQNIADELGGAFITLLLLSDKLGVDLLDAASQKLETIKQKYPVSLPKESEDKVIEYTEC